VTPDRRLYFLLSRADRAVTTHVNERLLATLGVTAAQLGALYHVAKDPGCSMTDVARLLDLQKSAVSGVVGRLERAGLVCRESNDDDARGMRIFVTEKGEAVRGASVALVRKLTADMTRGFDGAELDVVVRFLGSLVGRFGDESVGD